MTSFPISLDVRNNFKAILNVVIATAAVARNVFFVFIAFAIDFKYSIVLGFYYNILLKVYNKADDSNR